MQNFENLQKLQNVKSIKNDQNVKNIQDTKCIKNSSQNKIKLNNNKKLSRQMIHMSYDSIESVGNTCDIIKTRKRKNTDNCDQLSNYDFQFKPLLMQNTYQNLSNDVSSEFSNSAQLSLDSYCSFVHTNPNSNNFIFSSKFTPTNNIFQDAAILSDLPISIETQPIDNLKIDNLQNSNFFQNNNFHQQANFASKIYLPPKSFVQPLFQPFLQPSSFQATFVQPPINYNTKKIENRPFVNYYNNFLPNINNMNNMNNINNLNNMDNLDNLNNLTMQCQYQNQMLFNLPTQFPQLNFTNNVNLNNINLNHNLKENDCLNFTNELINQRYRLIKLLGKGSFGKVYKSYDIFEQKFVALKFIISNQPISMNQSQIEKGILQELNCFDQNNNHVVKLLDDFIWNNHKCMAFELLQLNLFEMIQRTNGQGLDIGTIKIISSKLLRCLSLLYDCNIIHCDLKPENIMVANKCEGFVKLVDFGSSCKVGGQIYSYIQSRFYRAPEVILELNYSKPIDIWSLGCLLAELSTCEPLFCGRNEFEQMAHIVQYFGIPPNHMITSSKKFSKFFKLNQFGFFDFAVDNTIQFTGPCSKSLNQYLQKNKPYSSILSNGLNFTGKESIDDSFENFIYSMLNYNPNRRATPYDLMMHPFIFNVVCLHLDIPEVKINVNSMAYQNANFIKQLIQKNRFKNTKNNQNYNHQLMSFYTNSDQLFYSNYLQPQLYQNLIQLQPQSHLQQNLIQLKPQPHQNLIQLQPQSHQNLLNLQTQKNLINNQQNLINNQQILINNQKNKANNQQEVLNSVENNVKTDDIRQNIESFSILNLSMDLQLLNNKDVKESKYVSLNNVANNLQTENTLNNPTFILNNVNQFYKK